MADKKSSHKKGSSRKKLRILAAGDIHGNSRLAEKLAEKAKNENVDLVILTGDLTWANTLMDGIIGPFAKAKKPVLMIPGNHEPPATIDFLASVYDNAKNMHGYSLIHKGVGIFGAGGAEIGVHALRDKEIGKLLFDSHKYLVNRGNIEKKIMITHMHPRGTKSELSGWEGSKSIRKAIEDFKPDVALFSHIHEADGMEEDIGKTKAINVGKRGKIIEL